MICSILPWLLGLGAALLGGWFMWTKMKQRLNELSAQCDTYQSDYNNLNAKFANLQSEHSNCIRGKKQHLN